MGKKEAEFIKELENQYRELVEKLDDECKCILEKIEIYFSKLGGLIEAALDPDVNKSLLGSIELCRFVGVAENQIIHKTSELDAFMLS